ncbi:HAMP domain-containing histidine kinase [Myxococcota bacterium]|nr:HAMP domain-containing histidine kinase [Myxococcota bacterium]
MSQTESQPRIRTRLTLATTSLVLAISAAVGGGLLVWSTESTQDQLDQELRLELADLAGQNLAPEGKALSEELGRRMGAETGGGVYLYAESSSRMIVGSWPRWPNELRMSREAQTVTLPQNREFAVQRSIRILARDLPNGRRLAVGRDITERERLRHSMAWAGGGALAIALLLGIGGGLAVSRSLLGRVERMNETILRILQSGRRERVPTSAPPDEFDALAAHFNQLLAENEALIDRMREVTNEVAHDLRTPLAHVRTRIEAALAAGTEVESDLLVDLRQDVDRILETFNALLRIAQIETGRAREEMQPVDLSQIAHDVCDLYEPAAEEAGLELIQEIEAGVRVMGHTPLLAQAITNLIENALKYAGQGAVTVSLESTFEGAKLAVRDRGPGIAAADRTRALQRFARLEASRSQPGAGLGLSLVAAVAELHEATLVLEDAAPGLRVALELKSKLD